MYHPDTNSANHGACQGTIFETLCNKMEEMFRSIGQMCSNLTVKFWPMLTGLFTSVIGYFLPVRDIVHLLILFFILDVIFGYWAAHKLRGERFSVKIIWNHTMPRMLISMVLITGAFMWDTVYRQEVVDTYKIVGWFISGVILFSIAENGYLITRWKVFSRVGSMVSSKIKDATGHDIADTGNEQKTD